MTKQEEKNYNDWWNNLQTTKRFELMKKYYFKNPNSKVLRRIFNQESHD